MGRELVEKFVLAVTATGWGRTRRHLINPVLKGHGFSRAVDGGFTDWALAPEVLRFGPSSIYEMASSFGVVSKSKPAGRNNNSPGRKPWVKWEKVTSPVGTAQQI